MTSAGGPVPAGTLRMVRAMACAYDAHRIHTDGVRGGGTEKGSAMTAIRRINRCSFTIGGNALAQKNGLNTNGTNR